MNKLNCRLTGRTCLQIILNFAFMKASKVLLLAFLLVGLAKSSFAQKPYFVYLQADDGKPFFVQLNKKNYSSSSIGHIVLPGLVNGTYDLELGYPGQNTMHEYRVIIENKDLGYMVKLLEADSTYALVDLQNASVQKSGQVKKAAAEAEKANRIAAEAAAAKKLEDEKLLAQKAAEEQALAAQKAKQDSLNILQARQDSISAATKAKAEADSLKKEKLTGAEIEDTAQVMEAGKKTEKAVVAGAGAVAVQGGTETKNTENKSTEAKKDETRTNNVNPVVIGAGVAATTAAIVSDSKEKKETEKKEDQPTMKDSTANQAPAKPAPAAAAPVFLDMTISMPDSAGNNTNGGSKEVAKDSTKKLQSDSSVFIVVKDSAKPTIDSSALKADSVRADSIAVKAAPLANPNCKGDATDADVELVSMIIKGEKDPEDALDIIKKTVKVKCVTTVQVRRLVELFESDEHRYALLDIAYRYTSDKQNFAGLANLLKDPYFVNRFKAMLQ